jgi:retinol-binding protein 3
MKRIIFIISICIAIPASIFGQKVLKIENAEKKLVIDSISAMLNKSYVFEDVAKKMSALINENFKSGKYKAIKDPQEFGAKLTEDLQSISKDLHLNVGYGPDQIRSVKERKIGPDELLVTKKQEQLKNYGFEEIKALPYGIGYLKLNSFIDSPESMDVAAGAMSFLSCSNALIIDLRENDGGDPKMIQFIISYFSGEKPELINTYYTRESNTTDELWTLANLPGKRLTHAEIYVLTSNQTFSAAEEFAYDLKNWKRATIVGETTAGAANPSVIKIINDNFAIMLPTGRAINPITHTNWEGVGVEPDLKVTSDKALDVAYLAALKSQMEKESNPDIKTQYLSVMEKISVKNNAIDSNTIKDTFVLNEKTMQPYVGFYGPRKVFYEDGGLVYQREKRAKIKMTFIKKDVFELGDDHSFQLIFIWEGDKVIAVEGHYSDGRVTRNDRDK